MKAWEGLFLDVNTLLTEEIAKELQRRTRKASS